MSSGYLRSRLSGIWLGLPAIVVVFACGRSSIAQTDCQVALSLGSSFYTDNPTFTDAFVRPWSTAAPAAQGLNAAILNNGDTLLRADDQAASFLVVRGGQLVHESYFNGARANQAKNIHSASKSILSALTGIAIRDGLLSLNTKIGDVLPQTMPAATRHITVQNLLTMTSGLDWEEDVTEYTLGSDFVQSIVNLPLFDAPGSRFNYSTGDTYLLGAVVAEASGRSLHQYGKQHLFDPLQIDVDKWGRDNQGYFTGGANFYLTPREMAAFGQLYLDNGSMGGNQIVPADWVAASTGPSPQASDYGYLWWNDVNLNAQHGYRAWGWGNQFIYVFPGLDTVVAITHDTDGRVRDRDINRFVRDFVIGAVTGPPAPRTPFGEFQESQVTGLANPWQNPQNSFDVNGLGDGPSPSDVILIINELDNPQISNPATGCLPDPAAASLVPPPFLDVNGDGYVSPTDAVLLLNVLDSLSQSPIAEMAGVGAVASVNTAVPEPETPAMLLLGLLAAYARRRNVVA